MNKSDLKDIYYVKIRHGSIREYYKGYFIGEEFGDLLYIDFFNEDLTHKTNRELDIVKTFNEYKNTIWERENEINWNKIPVGTKVLVSDNKINEYNAIFIDSNYRNIEDNKVYFRAVDIKSKQIHCWKYCKLAENPKEEVTYKEMMNEFTKFCKVYGITCRGCKFSEGLKENCRTLYILDNYNVTRKDNK